MTENLSTLELEVEEARAKLTKDLTLLRSPQTYRQLGKDLKSEAQSFVQMIWNDVKARAAANPSAALAISAGIAWRLLKDPPVATALIGAGVLGLWRARPIIVAGDDYFATAKRRFQEQVDDAMGAVSDYTAEASVVAQEKVKGYVQVAGETVDGLVSSAADSGTDAIKNLHAAAAGVSENTVGAARRGTSHLAQIFNDGQSRDHLLLGAAGLAVAAALGLAYQRRISDETD